MSHRPITLIVLDGWGYRESPDYNAIAMANTPYWDYLWQNYPHTLIDCSGHSVGLPDGQMGNSEVGHLHMGAGRSVPQDLARIHKAVQTGLENNAILAQTMKSAANQNKTVHLIGLLSPGGVHSHEQHCHALIRLAAKFNVNELKVHAILDGRDTPPSSALSSIAATDKILNDCGYGCISSLIGRYYAMDRDKRWDRTASAYDLYVEGKSEFHYQSTGDALEHAYERGESDEFVKATAIHPTNENPVTVNDGDTVIFFNFRSDRMRQLAHAFTDTQFDDFHRSRYPKLAQCISMTQYATDINTVVAFPPINLSNTFGEVIATANMTQLRIAETEKYAHVTFFFNGGEEIAYPGEDRILIPSPKVTTYDKQPEMSAIPLTDQLVDAISEKKYDAIICNYANADMVGHTGKLDATIEAINTLDTCLHRVIDALQTVGGEVLITADHGNAEFMFNEATSQPHTAHTSNLVPALYVGRHANATTNKGSLIDIAPTLLYLLGLNQPDEMTGTSLFTLTG